MILILNYSQATTANADDENSQAEGTVEGAVGYSRGIQENNSQQQQQNNNNNPHYENIYESIEQYAAANDIAGVAGAAIAPADNPQHPLVAHAQPNPQQQSSVQQHSAQQNNRTNNINIAYRNDLYDRTNNSAAAAAAVAAAAYDVPRSVRNNLGMRRNLQLEFGGSSSIGNRMRYGSLNVNNSGIGNSSGGGSGSSIFNQHGTRKQRSFDDTESNNYYNLNCNVGYGSTRYENIYEQIRDEPIYRNTNGGGTARVYGRLDVIGHGIGRIERHLSSSCGNIDHYNLGGHYAVLGHSHFGTVGHIRLNTSNNGAQQKDNGVKASTSSFFSCLGGENSQSMNNIYRASSNNNGNSNSSNFQSNTIRGNQSNSTGSSSSRCTGAIPKLKPNKSPISSSTSTTTASAQSKLNNNKPITAEHTSTLNRISKSSLQWLLVNKWLPLWIGQGPDCKIIDFNFMFSRNCDGCDDTTDSQQDLVRFNGRAEMHSKRDANGKPICSNLARLKNSEYSSSSSSFKREENNYENVHVQFHNGFEFGRSRDTSYDHRNSMQSMNLIRARSESPSFSQRVCKEQQNSSHSQYLDPFKNYELNAENNTFKPKNVGIGKMKKSTNLTGINDVKEKVMNDELGPSGLQAIVNNGGGKNEEMMSINDTLTASSNDVIDMPNSDNFDDDLNKNFNNTIDDDQSMIVESFETDNNHSDDD